MTRLQNTAAVLLALALVAPGCTRNRSLPTQLAPSQLTTIGVNAYLWRAALDTVSFAPLLQANPNSGVIITDWYANPKAPGERVKLTVTILDQDLRADALRVSASRETYQNGMWAEAPVSAATVQKLEDIILTRARDLRRTTIPGDEGRRGRGSARRSR
ncbi:MAG: DUF3576 domain-containing protein [Sphingomicrobium sp.]